MNKIIAVIIATAMLSGCAGYPRYTVVKGGDGGFLLSDFQEKRRVDSALAETGATWSKGWRTPATGVCRVRREYKDRISSIWNPPEVPIRHWGREDVRCVVWDATHTRSFRYWPAL